MSSATAGDLQLLDQIKKLAILAMFSDDELFDLLVLKGGNAMDLIHRLSTRSSIDLDFSMQHDFPDGLEAFCNRVSKALVNTFRQNGYEVFDVKMEEKPESVSHDMADFWGGYAVEFKLIEFRIFEKYSGDITELRKHAITIGQGKKFLIDISRFEYITGKQEVEVDGYRIYVYSPEMIVCEKLRAICQQLPEYGAIVHRGRPGGPRARDFLDIHILVNALGIDISDSETVELLVEMFKAKRVPISFLGFVEGHREFHRTDFPAVTATVKVGMEVESFDFYFDFVLSLISKLKPFWDK